jgi:hypothetical protein
MRARFCAGKVKRIEEKIDNLRKAGTYKPYPADARKPVILDYPFRRKSDQKYLDFFYSVSSNADEKYIPLTTYFVDIEPFLNPVRYIAAIGDKNIYDLHFPDIATPRTYLRKINGIYYDRRYRHISLSNVNLLELLEGADRIILKPSVESGSGKSIELFEKSNDAYVSDGKRLDEGVLEAFPDFVLQECVTQHPYFRKFNPDSNNTIRVLTYRSVSDDRIHVLHRLLRVGRKGSFLDHDNLGGIAIGISASGELKAVGYDGAGTRCSSFNGIQLGDQGKVPFIEQLEEMASRIAGTITYGRLLAFDFTVDDSGTPLLIEINCWRNGISQYQMNNGSLFQEFTREVLDYCVGKDYPQRFEI